MKYRADIDGLRTIAVLSVIIFHTGMNIMTGGFIGVDIFFTISGYLISSIIIKQLDRGEFSFLTFFIRRVRRLFPALLTVILISLIAGVYIFSPDNLVRLSNSSAMAVISLSNLHFAMQVGYWDVAAEIKPLLHTWSLSVEEQFYLFWPATLIFIHKIFGKKNLAPIMLGLLLTSIAVTTYYSYFVHAPYAFYLSPFRAYEFILGALVFLHESRLSTIHNQKLINGISYIGIILIIIPMFIFDEKTVFPGYMAMVPCIGTAMLLMSPNGTVNSRLLSGKIMSWIGRLSYSLYLVHWPLFAFYRYINPGSFNYLTAAFLTAITFVLAIALHYAVEAPLRSGSNRWFHISDYRFAKIVVIPLIGFIGLTGYLHHNNGLTAMALGPDPDLNKIINVHNIDIHRKRNQIRLHDCRRTNSKCNVMDTTKTNVLLTGDSHTEDAYNMFRTAYPEVHFLLRKKAGCPPFIGLGYEKNYGYHVTESCQAYLDETLRFMKKRQVKSVVLAMNIKDEQLLEHLFRTINLLNRRGFNVYVYGIGPNYSASVLDLTAHAQSFTEAEQKVRQYVNPNLFDLNATLTQRAEKMGYVYIDTIGYVCPEGLCSAFTRDRKGFVIFDSNHFTLEGAIDCGKYLRENKPNLFDSMK